MTVAVMKTKIAPTIQLDDWKLAPVNMVHVVVRNLYQVITTYVDITVNQLNTDVSVDNSGNDNSKIPMETPHLQGNYPQVLHCHEFNTLKRVANSVKSVPFL